MIDYISREHHTRDPNRQANDIRNHQFVSTSIR